MKKALPTLSRLSSNTKLLETPKGIMIIAFYIIVFAVLLYGSLGNVSASLLTFFGIMFLSLLAKTSVKNKFQSILLPPGFFWYFLFLVLFFIRSFWSVNPNASFYYLSYFISGLWFWLVSFNSKLKPKYLEYSIYLLGIILGSLTIFNLLATPADYNPFSLIKFAVAPLHHHHIGDLWAFILIVLGFTTTRRYRPVILVLVSFGFYFLYLSLSRSAYTALMFGSLYAIWKSHNLHVKGYIFWFYIAAAVFLFFWASTQKSTLLAHSGYLLSGLAGVANNPFGVGVGNFKVISEQELSFWPFQKTSDVALNIILEIMTGMGILGLSFVYWLISVLKQTLQLKKKEAVVFGAVFVTLTVNFLFDYTYLIPTLLWVWFISLGQAQARARVGL